MRLHIGDDRQAPKAGGIVVLAIDKNSLYP